MKPLRIALRILAGLVLIPLGLAAALLMAVQLDPVGRMVLNRIAGVVVPRGASLEAGAVSGSWLGGLTLEDVRWTQAADTVALDTLRLDWSPLDSRPGRIAVREATATGLRARLGMGSQDDAAPARDTAGTGSAGDRGSTGAGNGWSVRIEELELRGGSAELHATPGTPADPYRITALEVEATGARVWPVPRAHVDSLRIRGGFAPPEHPPGWGRARLVARLGSDTLVLDTVSLSSPGSRVEGRGRIVLDDPLRPGAVEWTLLASPLVMDELPGVAVIPGLWRSDTLRLSSRARTTPRGSEARMEARTSGGDSVSARFLWTREGEEWAVQGDAALHAREASGLPGLEAIGGPVALRLEGQVTGRREPTGGSPGASPRETVRSSGRTGEAVSGAGRVELHAQETRLRAGWDLVRTDGSQTAADRLEVTLDTLVWGRVAFVDGTAAVTRPRGESAGPDTVSWTLEARPASGGRLDARGTLQAASSRRPLRYTGRATLTGVQEPYSGSRINGLAVVEGEGTDPLLARATARLELGRSRLGTVPVDTVTLRLDLDRGDATLEGSAGTPQGGGSLRLGASASQDGGVFRLVDVAVDSLLPAGAGPEDGSETRGGAGAPAGARIAGRLTGDGSWSGGPWGFTDPAQVDAELDVVTGGSRFGPVLLDSARASAVWRGGAVEATGWAFLPDSGRVELQGHGTLLDSLTLTVEEGSFRRLNLASLMDGAPATHLQGGLTARYRAGGGAAETETDPRPEGAANPLIEAHLNVEPSLVAGDTLEALEARLAAAADTLHGTFEGRLADGTLQGELAGADLASSWQLEVRGDLPGLGGFLGRPDSSVALRFTARARKDRQVTEVEARMLAGHGWGVRLDTARLLARVQGDLVEVDTLALRGEGLQGRGGGRLPLGLLTGSPGDAFTAPDSGRARFELDLQVVDSATDRWLEGAGSGRSPALLRTGSLHVATDCDRRRCVADVDAEAGSILWRDYSVATARLEMNASLAPGLDVTDGNGHVEVVGLRTPSASVRNVEASAEVREGLWEVESSALIDDRRDARLALELDPDPGELQLRDLRFRMDEDRWRLREGGRIRYGGTGVEMDTLRVTAGDQRVELGGRWDTDAGTDLVVRLDSVRVGTLSDLLGAPGLDGWVDATVDVRGPAGARRMEAFASGALDYRGEGLHGLRVEADQGPGFLALDAWLLDPGDRRRLRVAGDVPVDERGGIPWDLDVEADSLPLRWIEPYLPDGVARGLEGTAHAALSIRGERDAPTAEGPLSVSGGRIALPSAGITLTDTRLAATFQGRTLSLDSLTARSEGPVTARGRISLPSLSEPAAVDLALDADDFLAVNTAAIRTVVDGEVELTGTTRLPRLAGQVDIPEAEIRLDEGLAGSGVEDVTLTDRDWVTLRTRFGILPPRERTPSAFVPQGAALDLSVDLGRDLWLRQQVNPEMQVQFTGQFSVVKDAEAEDLRLQGELEAIPQRSYLEQFGRRFHVREGSASLRGAVEETRIQVASTYEVPPREGTTSQVSVGLELQGQPGDLSLTLSSTPSMENADIVSYLATGRPASQAFSGGGDGTSATGLATDLVASSLTTALEEFVQRDVGLDVVEIRREGLRQATLVAGQYVTPELFLGFRQPVAFGSEEASSPSPEDLEAELEWQALHWLLLHLETGGDAFRFFLQGSYGY